MKLFKQPPPILYNGYAQDPYLKLWLQCYTEPEYFQNWQESLSKMGSLASDSLYKLQALDRLNEPVLTQWSPWGERIDHIELTALWKQAEMVAAQSGLVALPYEDNANEWSRVLQFALVYLFTPSSDIYSCPLAMTDGAATVLKQSGHQELINRALPHLTHRDPSQFWTSGQWMTEMPGGSDVSQTETIARFEKGQWRLYGRKWFTSATTSQMALALARPENNQDIQGSKGLALFYIEPRDASGRLQNIEVNRLKDKLGTRKVPTAELMLNGAPAQLVSGETQGVKQIAPMLNITRTWNAVSSIGLMRRGLNLAWDYASKRKAFGSLLIHKPLHRETLLQLEAEFAGAFCFTMHCTRLLGKLEQSKATSFEKQQLRLFIPLLKLVTAKQSVRILSEVIESFGGAGYVEDTGLPQLLRDAHVFPIWEGTTNVLALDALHVVYKSSGFKVSDWLEMSDWNTEETRENNWGYQQIEQALALIQNVSDNVAQTRARRMAFKFATGLEYLYLQHFYQMSKPTRQQGQVSLAMFTTNCFKVSLADLQMRFIQCFTG